MTSLRSRIRSTPWIGPLAGSVKRFARSPRACLRAARDRCRYLLRHRPGRSHRPRPPASRPLHVTLVATAPTVREAKLAGAARLCGIRVSLVSCVPRTTEQSRCFDEVRMTPNAWSTLEAIDALRPDVVHLVVELWDRYRWVGQVMRRLDGPVVYDQYDCIRGMLDPSSAAPGEILAVEKDCFARASHICSRHLEPLSLRRDHGYEMPAATYFADYGWTTPISAPPRIVSSRDELHVVYCGGIWPEDRYSRETMGYGQYLEIGRNLAKQRIHLHLYPAPNLPVLGDFDGFFAEYLAESARNRFFHIYRPLPHDELMKRLASYDAALHVYGTRISADVGRNSPAKVRYSSANKLFVYVEAGLPVIVHDGLHHRGVVRHYGQAIVLESIEHAREGLVRALARPRPANRASCSIAAQAGRLGGMYARLTGKPCPSIPSGADTRIEELRPVPA